MQASIEPELPPHPQLRPQPQPQPQLQLQPQPPQPLSEATPGIVLKIERFRDFGSSDVTLASLRCSQPAVDIGSPLIEARRFAYFLISPTFIYRDTAPSPLIARSPTGRFAAAAYHGANFAASIGFGLLLIRSSILPALDRASSNGNMPTTVAGLFLVVFELILPIMTLFILAFFALLHSWLNMWAELTDFPDRMFYGAWWKATSASRGCAKELVLAAHC